MQEPGELKGKEGGSKEGKQRGSQVSNANKKGSVRAGHTSYRKKGAEAETRQRGDKENRV